jgi:ArsR family transcriptional regulator
LAKAWHAKVSRRTTPRPDAADEDLALLAKALAHPARVRVLRLLARREGCIGCDIVADLALAQSTVSEHLRILKAAGLIEGEVDGPRVCYRLRREGLARLKALVAAL